eukprot:552760_1
MPRAARSMVSAYFNGSIHLFGGHPDSRQWVEYNVQNDSFIDHGATALSMDIIGANQFYTQIHDVVYWFDYRYQTSSFTVPNMIIYNLRTERFLNNVTMPTNNYYTCLTSSVALNLLFVFEGITVLIYNISNSSWNVSLPPMHKATTDCCAFNSDKLWGIGGDPQNIQKISLNKISRKYPDYWDFNSQDLISPVDYGAQAISYDNSILILGGMSGVHTMKDIQRIDCLSGNVKLIGYLNYAVYYGSRIMVIEHNVRYYIFGGNNDEDLNGALDGDIKTVQYLDLLTASPIASPTEHPTNAPSNLPSSPTTTIPTTVPVTIPPTTVPTIVSITMQMSSTSIMLSHETANINNDLRTTIPIMIHITEVEARQDLETKFHIFLYSLASLFIILSFVGLVHAKYIHQNDFFRISLIFNVGLQIADMCSDCFFVINLRTHIHETGDVYFIVVVISIFLIVMPVIFSIGQLWHHLNKYWTKNNRINMWITQYSKYLYLLSFLTGSSFSSVYLLNCNFCTLSIF